MFNPEKIKERFDHLSTLKLQLNMTRGKPSPEQLDLSLPLLDLVGSDDYIAADGTDCRNYGVLDGLPEAKELFAEFLEVETTEVIIGGNSSLALMHDVIQHLLLHGCSGEKPWVQQSPKFICPSPGYDRHFNICEHHKIEMITVDNLQNGPDMDKVEELVGHDASIKGIWIVPKYGNPTGAICSEEVVQRLASMKTAAPDFRIFWDNAYTVHHIDDGSQVLTDILEYCRKAGNPNRVLIFGSTSKITFAGAGVAMMGGSETNMNWLRDHMAMQTIGSDKLNQLRHIRFFPSVEDIYAHMKKHAAILRPKFNLVLSTLEKELGGKEVASWTNPSGGYFISLNTADGLAKRVVELASQAGVKLTGAGASFPYKNDPRDRNIRIAPSLPALEDLEIATEILCLSIQLAYFEKYPEKVKLSQSTV